MKNIILELIVSNIYESIAFYKDIFGFEVEFTDGNPYTWVQLNKNNQRIMLEDYMSIKDEIEDYQFRTGTNSIINIEIETIEELNKIYDICKQKECSFFINYQKTNYGKYQFGIYDTDKNMIIVSF